MILENINYFQEVVSPLYAFPVVGVVLCALLVFAFGFKTPAQPPSFDFVEHRKVAAKKKTKSKEIKTSKPVQNGSAHASDSASSSVPAKTPNAKPIKNETPVTKKNVPTENKGKTKKTDGSSADKSNVKPEASEEVADNSGVGEWTQQLSRKDRKNKKGKELPVNLKNTINLLTASPKKIRPIEIASKEKDTLNDKENTGNQKNVEDRKSVKEKKGIDIENKENIEENEISDDKENMEMKEKSPPAEDVVSKDATQDESSSKKSKKKKRDTAQVSISEQQQVESKDDAPDTKSTKEVSKKAKKSAKEGKKPQNADLIVTKEHAAEMQLEAPPKKVSESEAPVAKEAPPTPAADNKSSAVESPDEDSAKPTSNVVFDELGDMWQDAKPQKKKKKARRE